jgi:hypothetical protein
VTILTDEMDIFRLGFSIRSSRGGVLLSNSNSSHDATACRLAVLVDSNVSVFVLNHTFTAPPSSDCVPATMWRK